MTLEQLIEAARAKRTPEENAYLEDVMRTRMRELNKRLSREFKTQEVTEELLNRMISL